MLKSKLLRTLSADRFDSADQEASVTLPRNRNLSGRRGRGASVGSLYDPRWLSDGAGECTVNRNRSRGKQPFHAGAAGAILTLSRLSKVGNAMTLPAEFHRNAALLRRSVSP